MSIFRKELKYLVSESKARSIRHALMPFVRYDPYSAQESNFSYAVYSLYMDTPEKLFFHEKLNGVNRRIKIRIRTYHESLSASTPIFLECKNRHADTFYKERQRISPRVYRALIEKKLLKTTAKNSLLNKYHMLNKFGSLNPSALVSFYREAFFANHTSNIRLNFDRRLSANRTHDLFATDHAKQDILKGAVIFEMKFPTLIPHWLLNIVKQHNLELHSFSKYCTGLAHCDTVEQFSLLDSFSTYV